LLFAPRNKTSDRQWIHIFHETIPISICVYCAFRPIVCIFRQTSDHVDGGTMPNLSPTVPISFVQNMLMGARRTLSPARVDDLLVKSGIAPSFLDGRTARITREQFVRLYEVVAMATGDEMLGLWSRPIRGGTLKYLGLSLLDAPSLLTAMYRFTRFWNLLLDDYALRLVPSGKRLELEVAHSPVT
jgi:hypothetical protein